MMVGEAALTVSCAAICFSCSSNALKGRLHAGGPAASYLIVTCGADGTIRAVDLRGTMSELASIKLTDFPYSFTAAGGLVMAGCGDGSVHVIDMATMGTL
jgi:WD40 repeat protein